MPVTFVYETSGANIGMRRSMTDASGTTTYLNSGTRMLRKDTPVGTVTYTYDLPGNVLTVHSQTQSSVVGTSITYTYDKLNRLSTVATSYSGFLLNGQPPNGSTTTYTYDNVGNLQSITYPRVARKGPL